MSERFLFYTSIKRPFSQQVLLKGTLRALTGGAILLFTGTFVDIDTLSRWGWLFFALGMGLITWGLLPYKQLKKLEEFPDKLEITEQQLVYYKGDKPILLLPLSEIIDLKYEKKANSYGLLIRVSPGEQQSSEVEELYLPWFSKRTSDQIQDIF